MPDLDCNVADGHITAEADYELSPDQQERIKGLIAEYLSRLKVQMPGANQCPGDCKYYKGHLFRLFKNVLTWKDAKAACEARGGHLATSTSAEKNAFLVSLSGGVSAWLGATDEVEESKWRWVTGETWSYTNWHPAQPDNWQGKEHYLHLSWGITGKWNDYPATSKLGHICECEYAPRANLDPQDISHKKLGSLLDGNDEEHYHLTEDERTKLVKLSEVLISESD